MPKQNITLSSAGIKTYREAKQLKLIREAVKLHKQILHGTAPTNFLCLHKKDPAKPARQLRGTLKKVAKKLQTLIDDGYGIFMLVNSSDSLGRKTEDITRVNALFIDVDESQWQGKTVEEIRDLVVVEPHLIINTSPGNYHVYWLVEGVALVDFTKYQKRLIDKFGSDPVACDLPRVMRLAGTFNFKHDEPFQVKISYSNRELPPYSLKAFEATMFPLMTHQAGGTQLPVGPGAVAQHRQEELKALRQTLHSIPADDRNTWVKIGMALKGTFGEDAKPLYIEWSKTCPAKFDEAVLNQQWDSFSDTTNGGVTIASVYHLANKHQPVAANQPVTLGSLVNEFITLHLPDISYDPRQKQWFAYVEGYWRTESVYIDRKALDFIKSKAVVIRAMGLQGLNGSAGIRELLKLAELDSRCYTRTEDFDAVADTIGVRYRTNLGNECIGVIELKTGAVRPSVASDRITKVLGVLHDPSAQCPRFEKFIDEVTDGDRKLARSLQMALGYALFGHTKEQLMFIFYGESGENGKGVLIRTIRYVLGYQYCTDIDNSLLRKHSKNPNAPSPAVAALKGARVVTCAEFPKNTPLEESFVKALTGSDPMVCRGNYANQQSFLPQCKVFLHANDFPLIGFNDAAMWRRIWVMHFKRQFSAANRDNNLEDDLKQESSGILNWIVKGSVMYAQQGKIELPPSSVACINKVKENADTVGTWLAECCTVDVDGETVSSSAHESYKAHTRNNGAKPLDARQFKQTLVVKGFGSKHTKKANVFTGFSVKPLV